MMSEIQFLRNNPLPHVLYATLSHRGKVRPDNEDRLAVQAFITDEEPTRRVFAAVLSDGVGGNRAGEVAAQIGVDSIIEFIQKVKSIADPINILRESIIAANQAVLQAISVNPDLRGMGATCICALIIEKKLYLGNLGDSRAYLLRKRSIRRLSFDHTWLAESVAERNEENKKNSRDHALAHVLSRYLGSTHPALVDTRLRPEKRKIKANAPQTETLNLIKGDHIILCSDGLTDMLTDREINQAVQGRDLQIDVQQLIRLALEKGGLDNVSVILMKIP